MILITGGRGAVATGLTALLREHGAPVRVGSANPGALTLPDDIPTATLDLSDPATFPAALDGVTSVFLYANADHADEFTTLAHAAGVRHIVLLSSVSVLTGGPSGEDPIAARHLGAERALRDGPIPATFLRPGAFAGNAGGWAWPIRTGHPVDLPVPGAYTEPIHETDITEAAFAALTDPAHQGKEVTLSGPATMTLRDQVGQLADTLGRAIEVREVTGEQWMAQMADYIPAPIATTLLDLWRAADGRPGEPAGGVQELTGHPARSFAQWAADHRGEFEG
jgi:uncharacterized protein YbjT (DUF2867 family)